MWGGGVQQIKNKQELLDLSTNAMSLENRCDINQADLTPLMSTLLSIPVPTNSIVRVYCYIILQYKGVNRSTIYQHITTFFFLIFYSA